MQLFMWSRTHLIRNALALALALICIHFVTLTHTAVHSIHNTAEPAEFARW